MMKIAIEIIQAQNVLKGVKLEINRREEIQ